MNMRALILALSLSVLFSAPAYSQVIIGGNGSSSGSGGAPSGPAGGDLTGTYPNPSLATVNNDDGTYGDASTCINGLTVNAKGLITAIGETPCNTGAGDITAVVAGAGLTGGATSGSATLAASALINAQTGTSYTIDATDAAKLVTLSNGSAIAVTVPQATSSFGAGFSFGVQNKGAGTATLTPTTSTINGAASLAIPTNRGCWITSDGTNWQVDSCTALISSGSVAVGDITGLGTGVATLLGGTSSGTGGPAGTASPTFTGTVGAAAITASGTITGNSLVSSNSLTVAGAGNLTFSGRGALSSSANGFIQLGVANGPSPVAYTLNFQNGSGTNIAGQNSTINASVGSGNATQGNLILRVGTATSSGTGYGAGMDALTLTGNTGVAVFGAAARAKSYSVGSLPSATNGDIVMVTDHNASCSFGAVPTAGGSTDCLAVYLDGAWAIR